MEGHRLRHGPDPLDDPDFPDGRVLVKAGVLVEVTVDGTTVTAGMCAGITMTLGQRDDRPAVPADCSGDWGAAGRPVPGYLLVR